MIFDAKTLTLADLEAHDPEGGRNGRYLCPFPGLCSSHQDPRRHRSISIDKQRGLWNCKRCHAKGQFREFWKPFEPRDRTARAAANLQRMKDGVSKASRASRPSKPPAPKIVKEGRWSTLYHLQGSTSAAYLVSRGLDPSRCDAMHTEDFGYTERWRGAPAVAFALRDGSGEVVAAQGRWHVPRPWDGQKCRTYGLLESSHGGLYATAGAWDDPTRPLAICEAPIDAETLALAGLDAIATCGTGGLPSWAVDRLRHGRRLVFLAQDADENNAGDIAADRLAEVLREKSLGLCKTKRLKPATGKDFNEILQTHGLAFLAASLADLTSLDLPVPSPLARVGVSEVSEVRVSKLLALAANPPAVPVILPHYTELLAVGVSQSLADDLEIFGISVLDHNTDRADLAAIALLMLPTICGPLSPSDFVAWREEVEDAHTTTDALLWLATEEEYAVIVADWERSDAS